MCRFLIIPQIVKNYNQAKKVRNRDTDKP